LLSGWQTASRELFAAQDAAQANNALDFLKQGVRAASGTGAIFLNVFVVLQIPV